MRAALLAALVLVSTVAAVPFSATAGAEVVAELSIRDVTVTPTPPPAGEEFTVEATIHYGENGSATYAVESVRLLEGNETLDEVDPSGRLLPGRSRTIALNASFDTAGARELRLSVIAETSGGERVVLQDRFEVSVGGEQPQVDVDADRAFAETETPVTVTVANGLPADARNVEVRLSSDELELRSARSIQSLLGSGETATFEFPVVAPTAGEKSLTVSVAYTDGDGERDRIRQRSTLSFEPLSAMATPRITVDAADVIAGTRSSVNVTLTNGLERDVRDLEVRLAGDAEFRADRRVVSRLGAGESATVEFPMVARAGERAVNVTLRYEVDGRTRVVSERASIAVDPLEDRVDLEARPVSDGRAVAVEVFNLGNVAIENAVVRAEDPNATVSRALVDRLAPGSSETVRLNVTGVTATGGVELDVGATYDVGDRRGEAATTVRIASNPGAIRLTGVQVEQEGDRLHLTGSASNVGLSAANSVLVSVVDGPNVDPAPPNREYFVGTVPASDFVSFDLFARVDGNASEIPVRVTYLVDGDRREHVVAVPHESAPRATPPTGGGSGDALLPAIVGVVVLLAILAIVFVGWRNRDGGA